LKIIEAFSSEDSFTFQLTPAVTMKGSTPERLVNLVSKCRALGEGAITTSFEQLRQIPVCHVDEIGRGDPIVTTYERPLDSSSDTSFRL
jgi:hypothetical protein